MTGRRPLPTALKKLRGNPGKHPLNKLEPTPDLGLPEPPAHLSEEAKAEWFRAGKRLERLGLMSELDTTALAIYCMSFGRWLAAARAVEAHGLIVRTRNGFVMQNPALTIVHKEERNMMRQAGEFGMTPSSRVRLQVKPKDDGEDDPFREFEAKPIRLIRGGKK